MLESYPILERSPFFKGLSIQEISDLMKVIHFQIKTYAGGQMVVFAEEKADKLFVVLKGSVKGEMLDFSGKTIKIEDIVAPMPLAIAFLFGKENVFPVNIIANEETELLIIPRSSLLQIFQKNERILINFLNSVSNRSQFLSQKIKFLTFQTIKGKIANYLLQIRKGDSPEIILDKSQSELAELFGVTRPSVGRGIRELHNENIINAQGKRINILDVQALKECLK